MAKGGQSSKHANHRKLRRLVKSESQHQRCGSFRSRRLTMVVLLKELSREEGIFKQPALTSMIILSLRGNLSSSLRHTGTGCIHVKGEIKD